MGEGDLSLEAAFAQLVGGGELVGRVLVGVDEGDGDAVHLLVRKHLRRRADIGGIRRNQDGAVRACPFSDRNTQPSWDQWLRRSPPEIEHLLPASAPNLKNIPGAAR